MKKKMSSIKTILIAAVIVSIVCFLISYCSYLHLYNNNEENEKEVNIIIDSYGEICNKNF